MFAIPNSPRWLAVAGRTDEAAGILSGIGIANAAEELDSYVALAATAGIELTGTHQAWLLWMLMLFIASFAFSQGAVIATLFPVAAAWSKGLPFVFFAVAMVAQLVVVSMFFPETQRLTLEEMGSALGGADSISGSVKTTAYDRETRDSSCRAGSRRAAPLRFARIAIYWRGARLQAADAVRRDASRRRGGQSCGSGVLQAGHQTHGRRQICNITGARGLPPGRRM